MAIKEWFMHTRLMRWFIKTWLGKLLFGSKDEVINPTVANSSATNDGYNDGDNARILGVRNYTGYPEEAPHSAIVTTNPTPTLHIQFPTFLRFLWGLVSNYDDEKTSQSNTASHGRRERETFTDHLLPGQARNLVSERFSIPSTYGHLFPRFARRQEQLENSKNSEPKGQKNNTNYNSYKPDLIDLVIYEVGEFISDRITLFLHYHGIYRNENMISMTPREIIEFKDKINDIESKIAKKFGNLRGNETLNISGSFFGFNDYMTSLDKIEFDLTKDLESLKKMKDWNFSDNFKYYNSLIERCKMLRDLHGKTRNQIEGELEITSSPTLRK